jgi:hypothetical protein
VSAVDWTADSTADGIAPGDRAGHESREAGRVRNTDDSSGHLAHRDGEQRQKSDVDWARTLGIIGIVVGALGLLVAGAAIASRRKA